MLFAMENGDDLERLNDLASLQNHVKDLTLQDKLGKRNFHEDMKKFLNLLLMQLKVPPDM